ncbi:MAG TPA: excinuclease ABC subunit UvrA [Pirellulaceae bacterium]|nr:excinuclease ABC subunit UvrA [Pirellulaceae bacterium]
MDRSIIVRGARMHNLKGIDLEIPHGQYVGLFGVSGAGKSSLAIDTLFAEGQRRYVDSFSAYARQFLPKIDRPPAEQLLGIPPSVCLRGAHPRYGRRARVGSVTEISDYLRLWFMHVASIVCPGCGQVMRQDHIDSMVSDLQQLEPGSRMMIGFRLADWDPVGNWNAIRRMGFARGLRGSTVCAVGTEAHVDRPFAADEFLIVDRLKVGHDSFGRLRDSLETAFEFGRGTLYVWVQGEQVPESRSHREIDGTQWNELTFSKASKCVPCQIDFPQRDPKWLSDRDGPSVCPACEGFGSIAYYDIERIVPDPSRSIRQGAIAPWNSPGFRRELEALIKVSHDHNIPLDEPFSALTSDAMRIIWDGVPDHQFSGLHGFFQWLERRKYKLHLRVFASRWRSFRTCDACHGKRRRDIVDVFQVSGQSIGALENMRVDRLAQWIVSVATDSALAQSSVLPALQRRLQNLCNVGLGYLALDRQMMSLSRGEARRVQLASLLSSDLVNLLYVLEEPALSLHPLDIHGVASAIHALHHRGNTVVVIDHDRRILQQADRLIVMGPRAGGDGGRIVADGPADEVLTALTADRGEAGPREPDRQTPRPIRKGRIELRGARGGTLKGVDIAIPLNSKVVVCGVSGSGKSTLIEKTLYRAMAQSMKLDDLPPLPYDELVGVGQVRHCVWIDPDSIGRSSRSNAATVMGVFSDIRRVFAESSDAIRFGLNAGAFSFNSKMGQCPKCVGLGRLVVDLHFLADAQLTCDECGGARYRPDVLKVRYRDHNIAEALQMTAREAFSFFRDQRGIQFGLKPLLDVGLDYLQIGQPTTSLSAGECQRLKLASIVGQTKQPQTLFVIDEPTSGLFGSDIAALLSCCESLVAVGHSLVMIDNRLELLATADWIIELGPGAGEQGGEVIACGTPEDIMSNPRSNTGQYLRETTAS